MSKKIPVPAQGLTTKEPLEVLADIIQRELGLADGRVMIGFEKFDIDSLPGLYVSLQYLSSKPVSVVAAYDPNSDDEVQQVAMTDVVQVEVMSYNDDATRRRTEVLMALRSHYAQRAMETNAIKIARMPLSFVNGSFADDVAGSYQHRYITRFFVNSIYRKSKAADTFANFKGKLLIDEATADQAIDFNTQEVK